VRVFENARGRTRLRLPAYLLLSALIVRPALGRGRNRLNLGRSADLKLSVTDLRLLTRMRDQCDQLAVILISGRPLILTDFLDTWDALVAAWLPGSEGQGVADVLFGLEPFTGRLPFTWPRGVEQLG
jgi:hypothetical protein